MSNANVTVLTDENGVLREYRQVKRKANVGERVKITKGCFEFYAPGDIGVMGEGGLVDFNGQGNEKVFLDGVWSASDSDRYVVLEPTDVVIIDGVRYREERRKARVGDLIYYPEDQRLATVIADDGGPSRGDRTYYSTAMKHPHVVLTPIDAATHPAPQAPAVINVNLTITVQPSTDVAQAVADAVKRELTKMSSQEFVSHAEELLGLTKSPQQLRDEIVERAKRDIEYYASIYGYSQAGYYVDFVVNREKRTIVALIRDPLTDEVFARGIAKCAPGDVFNAHIGRAIALRRALGLPVPDEYLNAPQPTEVRVGDVVEYRGFKFSIVSPDSGKHGWSVRRAALHSPVAICGHIIDDSRDQTEVSA